ncbi:hypothetical protein SI65_06232 [Aspergillus cristatus]|uniref:RRM domain-containing protein n=1 Tax=Aspergillus cristatus TaxID=573508 RepID=A0A1E3BC63_ASPCR|nr:hypothetical protein SI65_06232 [Aspergillus cristatus]
MVGLGEGNEKKRKLSGDELEIDVSAPEPPSKKALRKAKKQGIDLTAKAIEEQQKKEQAEKAAKTRSEYGIWIGNLAFSINKDDLRKFFTSNCSFADTTITRVHMPKGADKFNKAQNKGFAYVDFAHPNALKEAMGLNEQMLMGRRVLIKNSKSFEGRPDKPQDDGQGSKTTAASGNAPSRRIFVGNLGFDVTKEALEEHFGQCGTLAHLHMATFQDTGKCKGYAWVEFEDIAAAEAAVKGYVMVNEEEEEEESDSDSDSDAENRRSKPKKPKQRRVWVNQLMGRRMRMEFAEDPTTRYKKRFGKEGEGKARGDQSEAVEEDTTGGQSAPARPKKAKKPEYSRYDEGTVQKLSGAIVESQGKKVTFD